MIPKPNGLQPKYGAQFKDQSIVAAYQYRPRYPQELFDILSTLMQPIDHYIESWHARNGLSRDRMSPAAAAAFDREAKALVSQYCPNGEVESQIVGQVEWGLPMSP